MNNSPWMVSCTLTLQTFAAAAIDIFRSSSDKSVALYLLILLQSSVVIINQVIRIHTINLSEKGKLPPNRDSSGRVCLHCCFLFSSGGVRTGIAMHCGCRIFKMAAKVEKFPWLYALYFDRHSSFLRKLSTIT